MFCGGGVVSVTSTRSEGGMAIVPVEAMSSVSESQGMTSVPVHHIEGGVACAFIS